MDIDYFERLMNYDAAPNVQCMNDSYNFNVGDVILDVEKNSHYSESVENMNRTFDCSEIDNRQLINDERYESSAIDNSRTSSKNNVVTVNFNAYNEIHSPSTDVDTVMTTFGEKLAEAVTLAAEGIHW